MRFLDGDKHVTIWTFQSEICIGVPLYWIWMELFNWAQSILEEPLATVLHVEKSEGHQEQIGKTRVSILLHSDCPNGFWKYM